MTDTMLNANRRATRNATPTPAPERLADVLERCLVVSTTPEELQANCQRAGIDMAITRRADGQIQGTKVRARGADEWLKASSISRELGWSKLSARLARQAERRAKAQAEADRHNAAVRAWAQQAAAAHLAEQTALDAAKRAAKEQPPASRALVASAATETENEVSDSNKLEFLDAAIRDTAPPAERELPPRQIDDAAVANDADIERLSLADAERLFAAKLQELPDAGLRRLTALMKAERERQAEAWREFEDAQARQAGEAAALSALLWLLLRLAVRLLTLGMVDVGYPRQVRAADDHQHDQHTVQARAARAVHFLAERAGKELARRARARMTRVQCIEAELNQLEARRIELVARHEAARVYTPGLRSRMTPAAEARARVKAEALAHAERRRAAGGLPAVPDLLAAVHRAEANVQTVGARAPRLAGLLVPGVVSRHRRALEAAQAAAAKARERHELARRQLDELADELERSAALQARQLEIEQELGELAELPAKLRELQAQLPAARREDERERIGFAARQLDAEADERGEEQRRDAPTPRG